MSHYDTVLDNSASNDPARVREQQHFSKILSWQNLGGWVVGLPMDEILSQGIPEISSYSRGNSERSFPDRIWVGGWSATGTREFLSLAEFWQIVAALGRTLKMMSSEDILSRLLRVINHPIRHSQIII